jgi:hypothetical protein
MANTIFLIVVIYVGLGLCFGGYLVILGAARLDAGVKQTSIWFRIFILPGSVALWPVMTVQLILAFVANKSG